MFVDTDVLIWGLKQNAKAVALLDSLEVIHISAVVCMELLQGARDKHDLKTIKQSLQDVGMIIVPINEAISKQAILLVEQFSLSHQLYLADALIAATALDYRQTLISGNKKHYVAVPGLDLEVFRPSH